MCSTHHIQGCALESLSFSVWEPGWHAHFHLPCQVTNITHLTPRSTSTHNAISGYVMVFLHASLISCVRIEATIVTLSACSPDCLYCTKIKKHAQNEGEYHEMALCFNFFSEGQGFIMRLTKEQSSGQETCIKGTFPISKGKKIGHRPF